MVLVYWHLLQPQSEVVFHSFLMKNRNYLTVYFQHNYKASVAEAMLEIAN